MLPLCYLYAKGSRKNNPVVPRAFLGPAGKARFAGNGCSLGKKRNAASGIQGRPNTGTYFCASPNLGGHFIQQQGGHGSVDTSLPDA